MRIITKMRESGEKAQAARGLLAVKVQSYRI
jgi:hypothetical protein